ncbi:MAG: hypothetical protein ACKVRP_09390, partial [Bacteroidota bacterium]
HCIDLELPFVFLSGSFRNHARSPPLFEDTGFSLCLQIGVRTKLTTYNNGNKGNIGNTGEERLTMEKKETEEKNEEQICF